MLGYAVHHHHDVCLAREVYSFWFINQILPDDVLIHQSLQNTKKGSKGGIVLSTYSSSRRIVVTWWNILCEYCRQTFFAMFAACIPTFIILSREDSTLLHRPMRGQLLNLRTVHVHIQMRRTSMCSWIWRILQEDWGCWRIIHLTHCRFSKEGCGELNCMGPPASSITSVPGYLTANRVCHIDHAAKFGAIWTVRIFICFRKYMHKHNCDHFEFFK